MHVMLKNSFYHFFIKEFIKNDKEISFQENSDAVCFSLITASGTVYHGHMTAWILSQSTHVFEWLTYKDRGSKP